MRKNKIFGFMLIMIFMISNSFAVSVELVKTDPSPIVGGDYADVTIRFTNIETDGKSLKDVTFNLDETKYVEIVSVEDNSINEILSGESVTRTFRIFFSEEIEQGFIDLTFLINYNGISQKKDIRVFVEDSAREAELLIGQITSIPNELLVDTKNNKIKINLQNLGDKDAELVKATLVPLNDNLKAAYSFSLQDSLASIKGGTESEVEFTIDIEEEVVDKIPVRLDLRYRVEKSIGSNYETFEKSLEFDLAITPSPYLIIESIEQIDDFSIGSTENKLLVTVKNIGLEDAEDVRVRIVPDISYPFLFEENAQYVSSNIKPGESGSVIYKIEVLEDAEIREYIATAVVESLVEDSRYSREDIVGITPSEGGKTDIRTIGFIVVLIVFVVSISLGINTYLTNKKKKKFKK